MSDSCLEGIEDLLESLLRIRPGLCRHEITVVVTSSTHVHPAASTSGQTAGEDGLADEVTATIPVLTVEEPSRGLLAFGIGEGEDFERAIIDLVETRMNSNSLPTSRKHVSHRPESTGCVVTSSCRVGNHN